MFSGFKTYCSYKKKKTTPSAKIQIEDYLFFPLKRTKNTTTGEQNKYQKNIKTRFRLGAYLNLIRDGTVGGKQGILTITTVRRKKTR